MNEVRRAIESTLDNDATLLALLGTAADTSIIAEYEVTNQTARPFITVRYDGSASRNHFAVQTWTILCYIDPNTDTFYKSSLILKKVRDALDFAYLPISTSSGVVCCECNFFMDIPTYYDALFDALVEGQRYKVYVRDV